MVRFTIKRDRKGKFRFAALQSEQGQALLKRFGLPANDPDSFVYIRDDKYFLRSSAGLHVLKELGVPWKLFYFLIIIPVPMRDLVYSFIAKSRYKIFGKSDNCTLYAPEIRERFL